MNYTTITKCRSCGAEELHQVLDLGKQPLANELVKTHTQPQEVFPLTVVFCPACSLVQIRETVAPERLFRDYKYFSSVSQGVVKNGRDAYQAARYFRGENEIRLVVEAASNDGYLLKNYQDRGIRVLGIDPAQNIALQANAAGVETWADYFGLEMAKQVIGARGKADVFHANNVLAHVADTNDFVAGIREVLASDGVALIEVPYLGNMVRDREFDTVYHEHLCYFSLTALEGLFLRHGLFVKDLQRIPIHGGSLRLFVQHNYIGNNGYSSARVQEMLESERSSKMDKFDHYADFQSRVDTLIDTLEDTLLSLSARGHSVVAYGAPAKGSTLLNYARERNPYYVITLTADKSPHKQGLYMPGGHVKITSPEEMLSLRPDYLLLLAWNFKGEISRSLAGYLKEGGRLIVPVPNVEILDEPLPASVV